jgi:signal transduction histidine kinase
MPPRPTHFAMTGQRRADCLLLAAMMCLWLVAAGFAVPHAYSAHEYTRLGLFLGGSALFLSLTGGLLNRWYAPRSPWVYFAHQLICLVPAVLPLRNYAPVWLLVLPAASQAVMVLPPKRLVFILAAHLALAASNVLDIPPGQIALTLINVLSSFTFTVGCSYVVRRERESRRQLHEAHEQLKAYAEKVQGLAAAEERNRLAQEIHDGAAHHLTAANMLVEGGIAVLPPATDPTAIATLRKAQGQIRAALTELRAAIAQRFQLDTEASLETRIRRLMEEGNFSAQLTVLGDTSGEDLNLETQHALYRVAQEALTNAGKHAPGSAVLMTLDFTRAGTATLCAENDENSSENTGDGAVGLLSLRDRIQKLGGRFHAGSDPTRRRFVVKAEVSLP